MKKLRMNVKLIIAAVIILFLSGCNDNSFYDNAQIVNDEIIGFENERELISILNELEDGSVENRNSITKLQNFNSMLNAFDKIYTIENESDYEEFLLENRNFLQITEIIDDDSIVNKICSLKLNLLLASIVNTNGELKVSNRSYNLLDTTDLAHFTCLLIDNLSSYSTLKSVTVSIPDYLPILIPMDASFYFPYIYPTKYFITTISGRSVIVQLWKGYCPGIWGYAGGVGAEVGLYYPVKWSTKIWFPDYKNPKYIYYNLKLKSTGESVLTASGNTWWLNKWRKDYIGLPLLGESYTLYYQINGVSRQW